MFATFNLCNDELNLKKFYKPDHDKDPPSIEMFLRHDREPVARAPAPPKPA